MAALEKVPARRAALMLHGLPSRVRERVIARLSASESTRLRPLLDELAELGVPRSLGKQLHSIVASPRVADLSAQQVARCFQACAPATVAVLLRAGAWPWKAQVLALLPPLRRMKVLDFLRADTPMLAPAMLAFLCERLCLQAAEAYVDRAPVAAPPPVKMPWVATLLQSIRRWR